MNESGASGDGLRVADRLALRRLVEAYAQGADRRRPEQVAEQFTPDGVLTLTTDPDGRDVRAVRTGRDEIGQAMAGLDRYRVTTHLLGQQLVDFHADDPDRADGETYCQAHHLAERAGTMVDRVMSIRYLDRYVRLDGTWLIAHRLLCTDWVHEHAVVDRLSP